MQIELIIKTEEFLLKFFSLHSVKYKWYTIEIKYPRESDTFFSRDRHCLCDRWNVTLEETTLEKRRSMNGGEHRISRKQGRLIIALVSLNFVLYINHALSTHTYTRIWSPHVYYGTFSTCRDYGPTMEDATHFDRCRRRRDAGMRIQDGERASRLPLSCCRHLASSCNIRRQITESRRRVSTGVSDKQAAYMCDLSSNIYLTLALICNMIMINGSLKQWNMTYNKYLAS